MPNPQFTGAAEAHQIPAALLSKPTKTGRFIEQAHQRPAGVLNGRRSFAGRRSEFDLTRRPHFRLGETRMRGADVADSVPYRRRRSVGGDLYGEDDARNRVDRDGLAFFNQPRRARGEPTNLQSDVMTSYRYLASAACNAIVGSLIACGALVFATAAHAARAESTAADTASAQATGSPEGAPSQPADTPPSPSDAPSSPADTPPHPATRHPPPPQRPFTGRRR